MAPIWRNPDLLPGTPEALLGSGWTVEKTSLYDEEDVEGWKWTAPNGEEFSVVGSWDEPPPMPEHIVGRAATPEALKPCPFCGASAHADHDGWIAFIVCNGCHAESGAQDTIDDAIAAWNRRTQEG